MGFGVWSLGFEAWGLGLFGVWGLAMCRHKAVVLWNSASNDHGVQDLGREGREGRREGERDLYSYLEPQEKDV